MDPEEHPAAFGVLLALGSWGSLLLGAAAAVAFQPAARSRNMAVLLATACGFMVASFFMEILQNARLQFKAAWTDDDGREKDDTDGVRLAAFLYGSCVLAATILLMAVAEVLADQPVARLRKMQELLAHGLQMEAGLECGTVGAQIADNFINGWSWSDSVERQDSSFSPDGVLQGRARTAGTCGSPSGSPPRADTCGSESRAVTHDIVRGAMERDNSRHLRNLARRVRQERIVEESILDVLCRLTGRSIVESDVTIDVDQFHVMMRGLISTCRTRNELIWKDLCKRNDRNWPTLVVLAGALEDKCVMKRGCTGEDMASQDPLGTEIPGLMGWALEKADRLGSFVRPASARSDGTPRSITSRTTSGELFPTKAAHMAHMQGVITRVRPLLEISLETIGAGTVHLITGLSLGLLVAADVPRGTVFAVLLAARSFPEGLVFAGDLMRLHGLGRRGALLAAALAGLWGCLGALVACGVTMSHGELSGLMLAAVYFVNGGIFLQSGLRKYLRAAVASDPEKEVPTVAVILGMLLAGIFLIAVDDHLIPSSE
jgi:zinc transporter ZupT